VRFPTTAARIAQIINGERLGPDLKISGIGRPDEDGQGKIIFLFQEKGYQGNASCLVVKKKLDHPATQIIVPDPRYGLYLLLRALEPPPSKIIIGEKVVIGPGAIICRDVEIGSGSVIGAGALLTSVRIGRGALIGPGCVIGWPGYGFIRTVHGYRRIPHIGRVVIGDGVELGANCTIDRGTFSDTIIGAGTKIDAAVHIGHNVRIGRDCLIVAQAGIAGSAVIGEGVMIGGQAGIRDGVRIGDGCRVLAKAGVFKSFPSRTTISGIPAREHGRMLRACARIFRLTAER